MIQNMQQVALAIPTLQLGNPEGARSSYILIKENIQLALQVLPVGPVFLRCALKDS